MLNRIDLAKVPLKRINPKGYLCDTQGKILVNETMVWDALQMVYPRTLRQHCIAEDLVLFCWEWNLRHKHGNEPVKFVINSDSKIDVYMCGAWTQVTQNVLRVLPKTDQVKYAKLQMRLIEECEDNFQII